MSTDDPAAKPHAVCLPSPPQSHVAAMLKLAKLLHRQGFHITFVNTEINHSRMVRARGGRSFLDGTLPPDFQFLTIPDRPHHSDADDLDALTDSCRDFMRAPFVDLVRSLNQRAAHNPNFPAVSCIVSDCIMTFSAVPVGEEFGVPVVNFWPISASSVMCFMQHPELLERGLIPIEDSDGPSSGCLDTVVDWIPGMKNMRLRDFPTLLQNTEVDKILLHLVLDAIKIGEGAVATVVHTFEALEQDILKALSSMFLKPVYAIGPLSLLLEQIPDEKNRAKNIQCNLLEENTECLRWLDSKESGSVLYVNFGSLACLTPEQATEFAMGIAESDHSFLWIIRPDLVDGDGAIFPQEFAEKVKERGFTAEWCPQEEVLNHPSIGGFLTHCGWKSTVESLSAGVPMLCWPYFTDQHTNCRFVCTNCEIGLEIDHDVKRDEVTSLVRELMEGEKGKKMKERALEWKKLAEEATGPCGSSSRDMDRLVCETLSK